MLVSRLWLEEYVRPNVSPNDWIERLTMSGLNFDGATDIGADQAINLEVTSNRPDCLGHLGVAREISALLQVPLQIPNPQPAADGPAIQKDFQVVIDAPHLCSRFTARLVRGVKIAASPRWLVDRLVTVGVGSVNNIVDITNYVMLECGQPLHAFDFRKLQGAKIIVREPRPEETLLAIDHKSYRLEPGMCVIADANRAVGLGGVMGGADTEVTPSTVDVLIEAAQFNPMSIRHAARKLNLHSLASYRFERTIDNQQIDWASRRCCQLILDLAGGQLAAGCIDVGQKPALIQPIRLRHRQTDRVLGIQVPPKQSAEILTVLGFSIQSSSADEVTVIAPSWRRDVTREIDLVEEIGRINGYEHVPDNRPVPMVASHKRPADRVVDRLRHFLTSVGLDEAMTTSVVPAPWSESFSPWTDAEPLVSQQPMLGVLEKSSQNIGQVNHLRRSLIPSLLEAFRINEYRGNSDVHLFELATVYLSQPTGLPNEPTKLAIVSQRDFFELKGVIDSLLAHLNPKVAATITTFDHPLFDMNFSGQLDVAGQRLGYIGSVSAQGKRTFGFRQSATVAELDMQAILGLARATVRHQDVSPFPSIQRDFNFVVEERVRWRALESSVRRAGGELLESVSFKELFRDEKKDGPDRKRLLLTVILRSSELTLTGAQADAICERIVRQCQSDHQANLVA